MSNNKKNKWIGNTIKYIGQKTVYSSPAIRFLTLNHLTKCQGQALLASVSSRPCCLSVQRLNTLLCRREKVSVPCAATAGFFTRCHCESWESRNREASILPALTVLNMWCFFKACKISCFMYFKSEHLMISWRQIFRYRRKKGNFDSHVPSSAILAGCKGILHTTYKNKAPLTNPNGPNSGS